MEDSIEWRIRLDSLIEGVLFCNIFDYDITQSVLGYVFMILQNVVCLAGSASCEHNIMATLKQRIYNVCCDKPTASGDENLHRDIL